MPELAEACDLSEDDINAASALGRIANPRSLDERLDANDRDESITLSEYVGREDHEFDHSLDRMTLAMALDTLPRRERAILRMRFYRRMSQRQIAGRIHISQMHVSRLERSALQKLRLVLQRSSSAFGFRVRDPAAPASRLPAAS